MELSQLRFKIHHRAGSLMGHADGLSRLNHLPMTDDEANACWDDDSGVDEFGEQTPEESLSELDQPRVVAQEEQEEGEEGLEDVDWRSNEDTFGLDNEQFVEEQLRTPCMIAMKPFVESGALTIDSQL
ncbi:hypothetical protein PHMEG_00019313 [Phytophthora megakarya]|uniref:Uncharacterized protein n=1 Tax=Phytophthora megakarya TaxID=4795 RepID=A0A225VS83_9STRA|nr:hypothetical protein PHMEG_00019313 [Phytophthora megakarya]